MRRLDDEVYWMVRYNRNIGPVRYVDYQEIIRMLNHYLEYVQQDNESTNDQMNDIKLMIHKVQHHIDLPYKRY